MAVHHPRLATVIGAGYARDRVGFWTEPYTGHWLADADALTRGTGRRSVQAGGRACEASAARHDLALASGKQRRPDIVVTPARKTIVRATLSTTALDQGRP